MPAAVESHHRDLMYKGSQAATLLKEPGVTVTLDDGEEVKLEPRKAFDKPNVSKSMNHFATLLGSSSNDADWDNLEPFLRGLVMAKVNVKPKTFWPKIARKACEVRKEQIIISCAERPRETGISLKYEDIAKELFLGLHYRAAAAGFQGPEMEALSRRAEHLARLLEATLNDGEKLKHGEVDARNNPVVIAVLLELAAENAVHRQNGEDKDSKVMSYTKSLLQLHHQKVLPDFESLPRNLQNKALWSLVPIYNASQWALRIDSVKNSEVGKDLQTQNRELSRIVEKTVSSLREKSEEKPLHGLAMYDQITGKVGQTVESEDEPETASPAEVGKEEEQP